MNSETQADIIREMRNRADTVIEGRVITARNFVPQETVEDWADRIEAARKRELGNAAALREALEAMLDECCNLCDVPNQMTESGHACNWRDRWSGCQSKAIDKARAAIAAPPRNCDRLRTAEEAENAFVEFCARASGGKVPNWRCPITCGHMDPSDWVTCCIKWLFAPATEREGGNNEDN